jgi:hypothetical protein
MYDSCWFSYVAVKLFQVNEVSVRMVSTVEYGWRSALMRRRRAPVAPRKVALRRIPACRLHTVQIKRQPKMLSPVYWNQIKKFLMFL